MRIIPVTEENVPLAGAVHAVSTNVAIRLKTTRYLLKRCIEALLLEV